MTSEAKTAGTLEVHEIFESICGEINGFAGIGQMSTFIRLTGCNLACRWCDTLYAKGKPEMEPEIEELLRMVMQRHVTITGGEPFEQSGVIRLANLLTAQGRLVSIETNGTHARPLTLSDDVRLIMDYKLPSSQMMDRMHLNPFASLNSFDWIKFVCKDEADFAHALAFLRNTENLLCRNIAFSPIVKDNNYDWAHDLCDLMIIDHAANFTDWNFHFSMQIHKLIGAL